MLGERVKSIIKCRACFPQDGEGGWTRMREREREKESERERERETGIRLAAYDWTSGGRTTVRYWRYLHSGVTQVPNAWKSLD